MELFEELRPLFQSMAVAGMFYEPDDLLALIENEGESSQGKRRRLGCRLYCYLVSIFLWFSFLRYIPCFWVGKDFKPGLLVDRVVHVLWYFQCSTLFTVFLSYSQGTTQLVDLLKLWGKFFRMYDKSFKKTKNLLTLNTSGKKSSNADSSFLAGWKEPANAPISLSEKGASATSCRLRVVILRNIGCTWIVIVLNMSLAIFCMFTEIEELKSFRTIICNPFPETLPVEIVFLVSHFLNTSAWNLPITFACTMCSFYRFWFCHLTEIIRQSLITDENTEEEKCDIPARVDEFRCSTSDSGIDVSIDSPVDDVKDSDSTDILHRSANSQTSDNQYNLHAHNPAGANGARNESCCRDNLFGNLENVRRLHLQLCACLDVLDRTLNRIVMVTYVTSIPLICFLLYTLVNGNKNDVYSVIIVIIWILINSVRIMAISISCALVHEAAHSPLRYLYHADVTKASVHQRDQLHLFVSKLTGPAIGFTALNIFTITKEMILTISGLLVTYFFLLLQFRI